MRPLNLMPPEERRGDSAPLRAGALSYVVVGVLAAALLAVTALVLTSNKINDSKSELASLQARQVAAEQASQSLAPYDNFATLATNRNATVTGLARSRFDWERVLQELALVIPADVTLQTIDASATADGGGSAAASADVTGPSLQISGCADGQEGTARFLAALRDIDGVTRVGMQSSTISDAASGPATETASTGCDATGAATFQITVAFDAVPTTAAAPTDATGVPATTTPAPAAPAAPASSTSSTPTDGDVAQTQSEQQDAANSAADQSGKARNAANTLGVAK